MGYKREKKIYKLTFADKDNEFEGLEVRCHSLTIGEMRRLLRLSSLQGKLVDDLTPEEVGAVDEVFVLFAKKLVSWNLEDEEGKPVPATLEGVESQDGDFINVIIEVWMTNVVGITGPLAQSSTDGMQSVAPSIPMEALSPNLSS